MSGAEIISKNELGATLYKQATEVYLDGKLFDLAMG